MLQAESSFGKKHFVEFTTTEILSVFCIEVEKGKKGC